MKKNCGQLKNKKIFIKKIKEKRSPKKKMEREKCKCGVMEEIQIS